MKKILFFAVIVLMLAACGDEIKDTCLGGSWQDAGGKNAVCVPTMDAAGATQQKPDTGTPTVDAGQPIPDAGAIAPDAGQPTPDTGMVPDAGATTTTQDAGTQTDGGTTPDAEVPDASVQTDAGITDAFMDAGAPASPTEIEIMAILQAPDGYRVTDFRNNLCYDGRCWNEGQQVAPSYKITCGAERKFNAAFDKVQGTGRLFLCGYNNCSDALPTIHGTLTLINKASGKSAIFSLQALCMKDPKMDACVPNIIVKAGELCPLLM